MKNQLKILLNLALVFAVIFLASCGDDNEVLTTIDPEDTYAAEIALTESSGNQTQTVFISDLEEGATSFEVLFTFESADKKMRRMYMTENLVGAGDEPYELNVSGIDKKSDGSLDFASNDGDSIALLLPFQVLSGISEGTVTYQIWTTSGRGDYRDTDNSLAVGVANLIVNYGGSNPATAVKSYSAKILAAPRADLASTSFISLLDGNTYKISEGDEYAAFWDFGYYYAGDDNASLASTNVYDTAFPFLEDGVFSTEETYNSVYFAMSTATAEDFAAITNASGLSSISKSADEKITNLATGDMIEFVDNYGKKGMIEVVEVNLGASGNGYDSDAFININVKVQP